jgi:hypothetical protein
LFADPNAVDFHMNRGCHGVVLQHAAPERLIKGGRHRAARRACDRRQVSLALAALPPDPRRTVSHSTFPRSPSGLLSRPGIKALVASSARASACLLEALVDETPAPVLDPGRGRTKTGYFWALSRDDRPWAGPDPPGVVYAYAPGRGAVHGLRLLEATAASSIAMMRLTRR